MIQEALDSQVKEALANIDKQIPPKNEIEAAAVRFAQQVVEYLNAQIAAVISQSAPGTTLTLSPEMRERARLVIINTMPESAQIGDPSSFIPVIEISPREAVRKALDPATFNRLIDKLLPFATTVEAVVSSEMRKRATKALGVTIAVSALSGGLITYLGIKVLEKRRRLGQ